MRRRGRREGNKSLLSLNQRAKENSARQWTVKQGMLFSDQVLERITVLTVLPMPEKTE